MKNEDIVWYFSWTITPERRQNLWIRLYSAVNKI